MNKNLFPFKQVLTLKMICLLVLAFIFGCQNSVPTGGVVRADARTDSPKIKIMDQSEDSVTPIITIDSTITKDFLMGKFDPAKHVDYIEIAIEYADRSGQFLHQESYQAFIKMFEAAKKDGIQLVIKSATRNFDSQKRIWEAKWNGRRLLESNENATLKYPDAKFRALKILEYSSMPGTSRHHWGTDMDFNAFVNSYFERGKGLKEYQWLVTNAGQFGFCQPYTPKDAKRPAGYNEEKWHWSYLPVAKRLSDQYKLRVTDQDIVGFDGAKTAIEINVVEKYVLGINLDCL